LPTKIISSLENKHVIADNIIVSSHPRTATYAVRKSTSEFLYTKFQNLNLVYDKQKKFPKKFLVSRKDTPRRVINNDDELSKILFDFDIETIEISKYTFQEAIHLFRNAELILSPHSAALTNIIFCSKGVKIIELFDVSSILPYYFELAKSLNLDYQFIISSIDSELRNINLTSRYMIQELDITLDINKIKREIYKYQLTPVQDV